MCEIEECLVILVICALTAFVVYLEVVNMKETLRPIISHHYWGSPCLTSELEEEEEEEEEEVVKDD
tara:strand:- start:257 stop:454 length:198 start_codon:yes stop_codon:yes gene_type:complete